MAIAVLLLVVVIVVFCARGDKGVAKAPTREEGELRALSDDALDLLPYLDSPTPAQKAEYVRRRGSWPDTTLTEEDREALRDYDAALEVAKRLDAGDDSTEARNADGTSLRKENGPPGFRPR